jgi:hypothetical protein
MGLLLAAAGIVLATLFLPVAVLPFPVTHKELKPVTVQETKFLTLSESLTLFNRK